MSAIEINFVYYSFNSLSSWQVCFLSGQNLRIRNLENGKEVPLKVSELETAIEQKQMRPDRRQNEYYKAYNEINNKVSTK